MENFRTGSGKIFHREGYKKLFRESYSRFLIPPTMTAVEAFEVLSAVMTSSPEVVRIKKIMIDFGVLGPTEFSSEVCFPLVSRASLRSATKDTLMVPFSKKRIRYISYIKDAKRKSTSSTWS